MGYVDKNGVWHSEGEAPKSFNGVEGAEDPGLAPQYGVVNPTPTPVDFTKRAIDKVIPFTSTPGVISSKDDAIGFKSDGTKLDEVLAGVSGALTDAQVMALEKAGYREGDTVPGKGRLMPDGTFDASVLKSETAGSITGVDKPVDGTKPEGSGDPVYDKMQAWQKEQSAKFDADALTRKAEYEALYKTSLASLDATVASTISGINATFDKRIAEQKRINQIRIDRSKAYGLGSDNALYNPMEFTDMVTTREEEAGDAIVALEGQRNSLIAQAKSARDVGNSKLLRDRLADLDKVDEQVRTKLKDVSDEADKQYRLLRDIRKDEEAKHKEAVAKMVEQLGSIAPKYADDFGGMSDEEQDAFINRIVKETGLDYATVFATLQKSVTTAKDKARADKKDQLGMDKAEVDLAKSKVELNKARQGGTKTPAQQEQENMRASLPDTFTDEADAKKQRMAFIKKYGTAGQSHWDAVYLDKENNEYNYEFGKKAPSPVKNTNGGAPAGDKGNAGKTGTLPDGRKFLVGSDGETLLDPKTKKPL